MKGTPDLSTLRERFFLQWDKRFSIGIWGLLIVDCSRHVHGGLIEVRRIKKKTAMTPPPPPPFKFTIQDAVSVCLCVSVYVLVASLPLMRSSPEVTPQ